MAHNEETIGMNGQKDLASPPIKAFDKEKLLAMQKQVVEGMTQNGNSQQCISGPVKRQVAEAWKNMRTHGGSHCRIELIFAFAQLPWSVVEGILRICESEVLRGCYEILCDALQRPPILACGDFFVVIHDSVVDVHHNAAVLALRSFVQYQFLVLL